MRAGLPSRPARPVSWWYPASAGVGLALLLAGSPFYSASRHMGLCSVLPVDKGGHASLSAQR